MVRAIITNFMEYLSKAHLCSVNRKSYARATYPKRGAVTREDKENTEITIPKNSVTSSPWFKDFIYSNMEGMMIP